VTRYIAFLRAVNVGGRVAKMAQVREIFEDLGFTNVRSYIQSGNLFFESKKKDKEALARTIEKRLAAELGYEVTTFVRTIPELEQSLALDPFRGIAAEKNTRFVVMFLSQPMPRGLTFPQRSPKGDIEVLRATMGEAYLVLHQQDGRGLNPAPFMKTLSDQPVTARFWATTLKILEAAKQESPPALD
jgi:uncharacterized protein (DUF1697 family)